MLSMPIKMRYQPPRHGWLTVALTVGEQTVQIDASDVPNNPVADLLDALDLASNGVASTVWWNLEPDGYSMYFTPDGNQVDFRLDFAPGSQRERARTVAHTSGSSAHVLLPFWRFVRSFQSRDFTEPHWPMADFARIDLVRATIDRSRAPQVGHDGG